MQACPNGCNFGTLESRASWAQTGTIRAKNCHVTLCSLQKCALAANCISASKKRETISNRYSWSLHATHWWGCSLCTGQTRHKSNRLQTGAAPISQTDVWDAQKKPAVFMTELPCATLT